MEAPQGTPLREYTEHRSEPVHVQDIERELEVRADGECGWRDRVRAKPPFTEGCLRGVGGWGVVCRFFVQRRDADVVAVDVPEIGTALGVDSRKTLEVPSTRGGAELVDLLWYIHSVVLRRSVGED